MKDWPHAGWWVDVLEGDVDPHSAADANLVLEHSPLDRKILQQFKALKKALKQADWATVPESQSYYDQLHGRIMAAVESARDSAADSAMDTSSDGRATGLRKSSAPGRDSASAPASDKTQ